MLQAIHDFRALLTTGTWSIFLLYALTITFLMLIRQLLSGVFYTSLRHGWLQKYPQGKSHNATAIVTVYDENPKSLERCLSMLRDSLEIGTKEYSIAVIIDGYKKPKGEEPTFDTNQILGKIAAEYADLVLCTNATHKRKNLRAMMRSMRKSNQLHEVTILVDSDTFLSDISVIEKLLRPFADNSIGGVTTSQLIENPNSWVRKVGNWLEHSRQVSSMAATSLFKQVPCLPGRMYAVRTELIEDRMDELVNDSFSFLGFGPWPCLAGDDRSITNYVLTTGYGTVMVPDAKVTTTIPGKLSETLKMWLRWGRSSQAYTLRALWLFKPRYWMAAFVNWGDILITVSTVYIIAIHWPYSYLTGHGAETLMQMALYAVVGMCLTVVFRQIPHLIKYPKDFLLIPLFLFMVTVGQFIRFWALLTPHRIGHWGTRGIKARAKKVYVWEYEPKLTANDILDVVIEDDKIKMHSK